MATVALAGDNAAAQSGVGSQAVDVDLVDGGVWVTYANGCVEQRAWRVDVPADGEPWASQAASRCNTTTMVGGLGDRFHYPRPVRGPLPLDAGEQVVALVPASDGYWLITSAGRVFTGGGVHSLGDLSRLQLADPIVAAASSNSGRGYYMLSADGGVFTFGDALFHGSVRGLIDEHVGPEARTTDHLFAPPVTIASTPGGYWLVTADGTVYPFGGAAYHGSIQDAINLNNQLAGVTRDWVLTPKVGLMAPLARNALGSPIVEIIPSTSGDGYLMVASDGGIFNFGRSRFHGSLTATSAAHAVAVDVGSSHAGYVILTSDGRVHAFGSLPQAVDQTTPTLPGFLPPSDCRPSGQLWTSGQRHHGFPLPLDSIKPVGSLDVGVVLVEFSNHRADRSRWPTDRVSEELEEVERYLETMSDGTVDVKFDLARDWISVGPLIREFLAPVTAHGELRLRVVDSTGLSGNITPLHEAMLPWLSGAFDLTNGGLGYEAVMVVFPPSRFRGSESEVFQRTFPSPTHSVPLGPFVNTAFRTNIMEPVDELWQEIAVGLLKSFGLPDLQAGTGLLSQPRSGWWEARFGVMGLEGDWPADSMRRFTQGEAISADGLRTLGAAISSRSRQQAAEMLAWNRWRLGWLTPNRVACVPHDGGTIDLVPMNQSGNGIAMAAMRLDEERLLVLERRTRQGYDADVPRVGSSSSSGWRTSSSSGRLWERSLEAEGVLAYVVDITASGASSVRLVGDSVFRPFDDHPVLQSGEAETLWLRDGSRLMLAVSAHEGSALRVDLRRSSWPATIDQQTEIVGFHG